MDGPSRGPALLSCPPPRGLSQGSVRATLRERGAVSDSRQTDRQSGREDPAGRPLPAQRARGRTHLIAAVCAGSAPPSRRLERRQGRRIPREPRSTPWPRARVSCAWRRNLRATARAAGQGGVGRGTQEGAGVGAPSPPAPRSAAGQLCLRRPRNVLCKHFSLSRGQAPRGCRRT